MKAIITENRSLRCKKIKRLKKLSVKKSAKKINNTQVKE